MVATLDMNASGYSGLRKVTGSDVLKTSTSGTRNGAATQKELRCRRIMEVDKKVPTSYKTSSAKEELLLQHI
jgi:hypothetical protein